MATGAILPSAKALPLLSQCSDFPVNNDKSQQRDGPFKRPPSGPTTEFQFSKASRPSLNFGREVASIPRDGLSETIAASAAAEDVTVPEPRPGKHDVPRKATGALNKFQNFSEIEMHGPPSRKRKSREETPAESLSIGSTKKVHKPPKLGEVGKRNEPKNGHGHPQLHGPRYQVPPGEHMPRESIDYNVRKLELSSQQKLLEYICELHHDLEDAETFIENEQHSWSSENIRLQEDLNVLRAQLESERKSKLELERKLSKSNSQLTLVSTKVSEQKHELVDLKGTFKEVKEYFERQTAELKSLSRDRDVLIEELDGLRTALTAVTAKHQSLLTHIAEIKSELIASTQIHSEQLESFKKHKDDVESTLAVERTRNNQLQLILENFPKSFEETLRQLTDHQNDILLEKAQCAANKLEGKVIDAIKEKCDTTVDVVRDSKSDQITDITRAIAATEEKVVAKLKWLPSMSDFQASNKEMLDAQSTKILNNMESILEERLHAMLEQAKQRWGFENLQKAEEHFSTLNSELESQVQELKKGYEELASENLHLVEKLYQAETKSKSLDVDVNRLSSTSCDHVQLLTDLRQQTSTLQIELAKAKQEIASFAAEHPPVSDETLATVTRTASPHVETETGEDVTQNSVVTPRNGAASYVMATKSQKNHQHSKIENIARTLRFTDMDQPPFLTTEQTKSSSPVSIVRPSEASPLLEFYRRQSAINPS